ncbi:MAG: DUF3341 domain-containing protein [Planctomycetota bacterium]
MAESGSTYPSHTPFTDEFANGDTEVLLDPVRPGEPLSGQASGELWGVLAEFDSPASVSEAAQAIREAGYTKYDVYSSYPIHEMEERLGLGLSNITYFTGAGALAGFTIAMTMQWFMNSVDYQFVTAGKPLFAWEQFLPVTFELSVLLAATSTIAGMFILNGLPRHHHALLQNRTFVERAHDDGVLVAIEARDAKFDADQTVRMLNELGATSVEMVEA